MVRAVSDLQVPHDGSRVAPIVTISVGVADLTSLAAGPIAALVARADAALYAAKRSGRNRFSIADEAQPDVRATMIEEQIASLVASIQKLNHGQRQALYFNLGGKKK